MWLLIDDQRDLNCEIIARNAEAGRIALACLHSQIETLALDNDLGPGEEGQDLLKWALAQGYVPSHVQLVTENHIAKEHMAANLEDHGFIRHDLNNLKREIV